MVITPYTLHPTPSTLHPPPSTLHTTPYTLRPTPYTLHPTPYTLHPTPYTLHPTPSTHARTHQVSYHQSPPLPRRLNAGASELVEVAEGRLGHLLVVVGAHLVDGV